MYISRTTIYRTSVPRYFTLILGVASGSNSGVATAIPNLSFTLCSLLLKVQNW